MIPLQRSLGEQALVESLPSVVAIAAAFLTQLGDIWFVFLLLGTLYLTAGHLPGVGAVTDRNRAAFVLALALGAISLTTGLKALFNLPRPPTASVAAGADLLPALVRPAYEGMATADGAGFPSGHALGSTVIYGGLALILDAGTRRQRIAAAALLAGLIGLSRVAIGVHYLADVVAGWTLGVAYLAVVTTVADRGALPVRAFLAAAAVAALSLVPGVGFERVAVFGSSLGGLLAWLAVGSDRPRLGSGALVPGGVGVVVLGGVFGATFVLEPEPLSTLAATAFVVGGVVALPSMLDRLPM